MSTTLGENLRELREKKGVPQKGLARAADVSVYTISRIESGKTQFPQKETLDSIAKALGVDRERLLRGVNNERPHSRPRRARHPATIQFGRFTIEEDTETITIVYRKDE